MADVIISREIAFENSTDVAAYKALSNRARPSTDMEFREVGEYRVGYARIVLFAEDGTRLAVIPRGEVKGMAVDGMPIVVHGSGFVRIGIPEVAAAEDNNADETKGEENSAE